MDQPRVERHVEPAPFRVARVDAVALRAPTPKPVYTSFGIMHDRPAVLVRIEDDAGTVGWGEVWCNFPACGAEHRARLVNSVFRTLLEGAVIDDPAGTWNDLGRKTHVLSIQCGEPGPFAQVIAAIDTALWDLAARRAQLPLWRLLGGTGAPQVPVYASGINPDEAVAIAAAQRAAGFTAFKLKVGFGRETDIRNMEALRRFVGPDTALMVDANQAWPLDLAVAMSEELAPYAPSWLEEPIAADRPEAEWQTLAATAPIPLAAGENAGSADAFDAMIGGGAISVVQPDLAKWGGISGCRAIARAALAAGRRYCPHFLGAGVGLLASAHLLKGTGGDGLLEVDSNPNPLREALVAPFPQVDGGMVSLPDAPGLGMEPDQDVIARYRVSIG